MQLPVYAVILAGGKGTRFWPLSRANFPKQFLPLPAELFSNGETPNLIDLTLNRLKELVPPENVVIVSNQDQSALFSSIDFKGEFLVEPEQRNTAPAIGLAASLLQKRYGDALMLVLPADHFIGNKQKWSESMKKALEVAGSTDRLVTIGIKPDSPHLGYGYIEQGQKIGEGVYSVKRFHEKPDHMRATEYYESNRFLWNSGMFVWKASSYLESAKVHLPHLARVLDNLALSGDTFDLDTIKVAYHEADSISVDYGILEKAVNCNVVVGEDFGWSDVGSWKEWAQLFPEDSEGNVVIGDVIQFDNKNTTISSNSRAVSVVGVSDLVVIETKDAVLVCHRDKTQDVKEIVAELERKQRNELL